MDGTDPTRAAANTAPPTAGSTSSTQPGGSPDADPIATLGERILTELGDPRTNNTLVRWLAHHTARLIAAADAARETDDPATAQLEAAARAAILQLWQARAAWPSGWPPPRAAEIARLLADLPGLDDDGWYRPTIPGRLHDLHYHVLAVIVDLATGADDADLEQGWLDTFGDQLTSDEALLLRRAAARPQRLDALQRWWERERGVLVDSDSRDETTRDAEDVPAAHPLIDLANAYRNTIVDLFARITATQQQNDHGGAGDIDGIRVHGVSAEGA